MSLKGKYTVLFEIAKKNSKCYVQIFSIIIFKGLIIQSQIFFRIGSENTDFNNLLWPFSQNRMRMDVPFTFTFWLNGKHFKLLNLCCVKTQNTYEIQKVFFRQRRQIIDLIVHKTSRQWQYLCLHILLKNTEQKMH